MQYYFYEVIFDCITQLQHVLANFYISIQLTPVVEFPSLTDSYKNLNYRLLLLVLILKLKQSLIY